MAIDPDTLPKLIVRATTNPFKCAGAIAARVRRGERVMIMSNGHGVFRSLEAIAVARKFLEDDAKDLSFEAAMVEVVSEGRGCVL